MKVEGNVELTEQKSRKNRKEAKKAIKRRKKNAIKNSINQKYADLRQNLWVYIPHLTSVTL